LVTVQIGTDIVTAGAGGLAAGVGQTAQSAIAQVIAGEAANTFGTDSVAEQIEYGFAGDVSTAPPMAHRLTGTGIGTPECFAESRDGEPCE
jgi:hypothetical protein